MFVLERLYHYVSGYTFTVQTDHQPLAMWEKTIVASSPYLQRLLLQVSQYDLNIQYIKKENVIADALIRVSLLPATKQDEHQRDTIPVHMLTTGIPADPTMIAEFHQPTTEDTASGLLMQAVLNGCPEQERNVIHFY